MRISGRQLNETRNISIEINNNPHAEGSCLVKFGNTHIHCTATIDETVPYFLRNSGSGWITAEYGMLPRSTHSRIRREAAQGRQGGRTVEIQRLIGRSLRAIVDLKKLGERQIILDCDVLQADGGTRTASITGAYVALKIAIKRLNLKNDPITSQVAAISCGIVSDKEVVDLDYAEDSVACADVNFVLTDKMNIVEIQGTAEDHPFSEKQFTKMFSYAKEACKAIFDIQNQALSSND